MNTLKFQDDRPVFNKTMDDLLSGNRITGTNEKGEPYEVIIGETDAVAFKDAAGWQIASNVCWNSVDQGDFDAAIGRRKLDKAIKDRFLTSNITHRYYAEDGQSVVLVFERTGSVYRLTADGKSNHYEKSNFTA